MGFDPIAHADANFLEEHATSAPRRTPLADSIDAATVGRLALGFNPAEAAAYVRAELSVHPGGARWEGLLAYFGAGESRLSVATRERIVLALMAVERPPPWMFAVHVYFLLLAEHAAGRAPGDTLAELGDVLLLVGQYAGIDRYLAAVRLLQASCAALSALAAEASPGAPAVFTALQERFD